MAQPRLGEEERRRGDEEGEEERERENGDTVKVRLRIMRNFGDSPPVAWYAGPQIVAWNDYLNAGFVSGRRGGVTGSRVRLVNPSRGEANEKERARRRYRKKLAVSAASSIEIRESRFEKRSTRYSDK